MVDTDARFARTNQVNPQADTIQPPAASQSTVPHHPILVEHLNTKLYTWAQVCCDLPHAEDPDDDPLDTLCKNCLAREMMAYYLSGKCQDAASCRDWAVSSCWNPAQQANSCTKTQAAQFQQWALDYFNGNHDGWEDELTNCPAAP